MTKRRVGNLLGVEIDEEQVYGAGAVSRTSIPGQSTMVYGIDVVFNGIKTSLGTDSEEEARTAKKELATFISKNFGGGLYFTGPNSGAENSITFGLQALVFVGAVQAVSVDPPIFGFTIGLEGGSIEVNDPSEDVVKKEREEIISAWRKP